MRNGYISTTKANFTIMFLKKKFQQYKDELVTTALVVGGLYVAYQALQPIVSVFGGALVFLALAYFAYRKRDKIRNYFK